MRFLACCTLLLTLLTPAQGQGNVLIIVADDMGVDAVGAYGEGTDPPTTPVLDSLAADGVLFRNAWSNCVCSPTRATIQTGRHSFRTGIGVIVKEEGWGLQPDELTLPELFDLHPTIGMSHGAFGKWHLGTDSTGGADAPNIAGYSHFAGGLDNFNQPNHFHSWPKVVNGVESMSKVYATTDTVDEALAWLDSVAEPWLCYVAFHAPHRPFHVPDKHLFTRRLPPIDPRVQSRHFYQATVEAMDTEIGRLLEGLGDSRDNTNIIFVGDNGTPDEAAKPPHHADYVKVSPYEGGINVPLIVQGPAVVDPGREVAGLVHTVDLFLSAAELGGVDPATGLPDGHVHDSVSFVPYLSDPAQPGLRQYAFAEMFRPNGAPGTEIEFDWRIARDGRYKLILTGPAPVTGEFFDLDVDPFEEVNLLDDPDSMTNEEQQAYEDLKNHIQGLLTSG